MRDAVHPCPLVVVPAPLARSLARPVGMVEKLDRV